jgi:hypothetical protein
VRWRPSGKQKIGNRFYVTEFSMTNKTTKQSTSQDNRSADRSAKNDGSKSATDKMKKGAEDVKERAAQAKDKVKEAASDAGEEIKEKAYEMTAQTKEVCREFLHNQRVRFGEELCAAREAIEEAAGSLEDDDHGTVSRAIGAAGEQIGRMEEYIKSKKLGELVEDIEDFAHKRPELFFGGMFAAGLLAARFFKASKRNTRLRRSSSGGNGKQSNRSSRGNSSAQAKSSGESSDKSKSSNSSKSSDTQSGRKRQTTSA